MGEATVRDIHVKLLAARPRAYTTVMTIMDRLAQKGIVTRRKQGRAFRYQANLSADEARVKAVEKIVAGFFEGSADALAAHLAAQGRSLPVFSAPEPPPAPPIVDAPAAVAVESSQQMLDKTLL